MEEKSKYQCDDIGLKKLENDKGKLCYDLCLMYVFANFKSSVFRIWSSVHAKLLKLHTCIHWPLFKQ